MNGFSTVWFVNNFHIQILAIELLFCRQYERRERFPLRLLLGGAVYALLPFVTPGGYFAGFLTVGWFTFGFLVMLVLSGLLLFCLFRMNVRQVIYYCCVAHTIQHSVECLKQVAGRSLGLTPAMFQLLHLLLFIPSAYLGYRILSRRLAGPDPVPVARTDLLVFASLSSIIVYGLSLWTTRRETATIGMYLYDLCSCVLLLTVLFDMFRLRRAEREQLVMQQLLRQEQEQHRLSKATAEVINRKCHDLKHQISALRSMNSDEQERSISQLEQAVLLYDSFVKSGSDDLDIILAEKGLLAEKQAVSLQCIADGKRLDFMLTEDIYSLMGNALDNAIEAASQEDNPGKRIIELNIAAKGPFLCVHISNPCPNQPAFQDSVPVTTKADTGYHGYGMRSMRFIAEKYGGALTCAWEDGIFSLDIIFPL